MKSFLLTVILFPLAAIAQGTPTVFPPSSVPATAQELNAYLSGKAFRATYADGTKVQSKYGADGSLAASAPGFYDTGQWRVEDGKLCGSLRKLGPFCNEARFEGGALLLRRMNGEIVRYEPEK
jgi:hypothetical protein